MVYSLFLGIRCSFGYSFPSLPPLTWAIILEIWGLMSVKTFLVPLLPSLGSHS